MVIREPESLEEREYRQTEGIAILNPANDHYYEVVIEDINWDNAKAAAEKMAYRGLQGHLAAITSQDENNFIAGILPLEANFWIGAFQTPGSPEPDGNWQWITGESFNYTNWAEGEPNEASERGMYEDSLEFYANGKWNDVLRGSYILPGYIVEYEPAMIPEH